MVGAIGNALGCRGEVGGFDLEQIKC